MEEKNDPSCSGHDLINLLLYVSAINIHSCLFVILESFCSQKFNFVACPLSFAPSKSGLFEMRAKFRVDRRPSKHLFYFASARSDRDLTVAVEDQLKWQ